MRLQIGQEEQLVIDMMSQRIIFTQFQHGEAQNISIPLEQIGDAIVILKMLEEMTRKGVVSNVFYQIKGRQVIGSLLNEQDSTLSLHILYSENPDFSVGSIIQVDRQEVIPYQPFS